MSATAQYAHSIAKQDDTILKGVKRSRFSFHLNTRHMRRWLLIQFVTVPADATNAGSRSEAAREASLERPKHETLASLTDRYSLSRAFNRCS